MGCFPRGHLCPSSTVCAEGPAASVPSRPLRLDGSGVMSSWYTLHGHSRDPAPHSTSPGYCKDQWSGKSKPFTITPFPGGAVLLLSPGECRHGSAWAEWLRACGCPRGKDFMGLWSSYCACDKHESPWQQGWLEQGLHFWHLQKRGQPVSLNGHKIGDRNGLYCWHPGCNYLGPAGA